VPNWQAVEMKENNKNIRGITALSLCKEKAKSALCAGSVEAGYAPVHAFIRALAGLLY